MQELAHTIEINSDATVIEKVLNGDIALFEVIVRRYNSVIYKIARSYGFNHQDCEDLMQDTHVSAYLALEGFEGRSSYKTWISRIMVNKCLYKLKYGYYKNEVPSEQVSDPNHQPMHVRKNDNSTETSLLNRELSSVLEQSLNNLPTMYRTVFVLREIEGFSVAETADLIGITDVNVKVRLNRAKSLLQKQIECIYSRADLYSFNLVYCDAIVDKVFQRIKSLKGRI